MADETAKTQALARIYEFFVSSRDFNGIPGDTLAESLELSEGDLVSVLAQLVEENEVNIAFYKHQVNPHILGLPPLSPSDQVHLLVDDPNSLYCAYPTERVLLSRPDLGKYDDQPFGRRLALGEAQLTAVFFELPVLERYLQAPRYDFAYHDSGGYFAFRASADESSTAEPRDCGFLQTFGIGYEEESRTRVVGVYLRYLADLSSEHQQVWLAHVIDRPCVMNSDYARSSLYGQRPQFHSAYLALLTEIQEINKLSRMVGKPALFRDDFRDDRPPGFHPMLRPTRKAFDEFVHLLDKVLSENLNRDFFRGDVPLDEEEAIDEHRVRVRPIGTVNLLRNWLRKLYRPATGEDVSDDVVEPLRRVRALRQQPAHSIQADVYDLSLPSAQRELVADVKHALEKLRLALSAHSECRGRYEAPAWLDGDKIVFY